jgi:hypothetical protein
MFRAGVQQVPSALTFHHLHLLKSKTDLRVNAARIVMQSSPQLAPRTLIFYCVALSAPCADHIFIFSSPKK